MRLLTRQLFGFVPPRAALVPLSLALCVVSTALALLQMPAALLPHVPRPLWLRPLDDVGTDEPAAGLVRSLAAAAARGAARPAPVWSLLYGGPGSPFVEAQLPPAAAAAPLSPLDGAQADALAAALAQLPVFEGLVAARGAAAARGGGALAPQLHLITVASRPNAYLEVLQTSARAHGWDRVAVLGVGDTLLGPGWGTNYGRKILHIVEHVKQLPPRDLVFFVDAHDVVVMGDAREAVEGFFRGLARSMLREPLDPACEAGASPLRVSADCGATAATAAATAEAGGGGNASAGKSAALRTVSPARAAALGLSPPLAALLSAPGRRVPTVLISGETGCMEELEAPAFDKRLTAGLRFPCLCSGQFAGTAGELVRFLTSLPWDSDMNDQATFYRMMGLARRDSARALGVVDHEADLFLSMWGLDAEREIVLDPRSRRWRHATAAGAGPVFWHWNGWRKKSAFAVGLVTGERGIETGALLHRALNLGAASGAALLLLGLAAGFALGRALGSAVTGGSTQKQQPQSLLLMQLHQERENKE